MFGIEGIVNMKRVIAAFFLGITIPILMASSYGGSLFLSTSIDTLTATLSNEVQLVASLGTWSESVAPLANIQAVATHAAGGAGVRHVLTTVMGCTVTTAGGATTAGVLVRDGASGSGTILWIGYVGVAAVAGEASCVGLSGLALTGSDNTIMTVEATVAPGADNFQSISFTGYSVR